MTAAGGCSSAPTPTIASAVAAQLAGQRRAHPPARRRSMLDQTKLLIRPAGEEDLQKVLELYAQPAFDAGNVLPLETAKSLLRRFADYPDYTLYVAERDGEVVGSFALLVMHNLGHLGTPSAIVEDV